MYEQMGHFLPSEVFGFLCYDSHMNTKVTISRQKYDALRRQASAWRYAIGTTVTAPIFNAVRDNGGEGIEAGILAEKLRALIQAEA